MAGGIPHGAVGASVGVLIYSFLCGTLSTLLVCLLWSYGERWTYVTLLAIFATLSTTASIIQQFHYATDWANIKEADYRKAIESIHEPSLAFFGPAQKVDVVLYWIQFYCYNVMSLMVLFWAVALFIASWEIHVGWLGEWRLRMGTLSKIFAVLFSGLIVGLSNVEAIADITALDFVIMNMTMFVDLSAGSVFLVLILVKYLKTRRVTARNAERSPWWASGESESTGSQTTSTPGTNELEVTRRQSIYDRALVIRFTIGFVILAVFEILIILFAFLQVNSDYALAQEPGPDFSLSSTISDIVLFMPGVTASLVVFLVFGTNKSWRKYRDLVLTACRQRYKVSGSSRSSRRQSPKRNQRLDPMGGLEFERLPSRLNDADAETGQESFLLSSTEGLDVVDSVDLPIQGTDKRPSESSLAS